MSALAHRPSGEPKVRAIPAGGTWKRGRGRALAPLFAVLLPDMVMAAELPVLPSGQQIALHDKIIDTDAGADAIRFRFVAPELGQDGRGYHDMAEDFGVLCQDFALPELTRSGEKAGQILITLMREPVEFGVMTPDTPQFFERFSVKDGLCIWEAF